MPKVLIELQANTQDAVRQIQQFAKAQKDAFDAVKAGSPTLIDAKVKISQLMEAKNGAAKAGQQWQQVLSQLPGPLGQVSTATQTVTTALSGPAGMVAAMVAVAVAGVTFAKSLADDVERLDNLSRQTGLSVSALQAFEQAAREAGESPDTLIQGLGKVNAAINDVVTGAPNAGKAFKDIGVDIRGLVQSGASASDILEETAKKLLAIDDPTRRAAAAFELFGLRGRAMTTVLDRLAKEGVSGFIAAMREMGVVTSDETNEMARRFDEMFDGIMRSGRGWLNFLKGELLTVIVRTVEEIKQLTQDPKLFFDPSELKRRVDETFQQQRPPPQDRPRTLAPTAEETKALEELEKRAEEGAKAVAQFFATLQAEETAQFLGEDLQFSAEQFDKLDDAAKRAESAFRDWTPSIKEGSEGLRTFISDGENYRSVMAGMVDGGEDYVRVGDQITHTNLGVHGGLASLANVSMQTGEGFSILTGKLTNFDAELQRGQKAAEGVEETLRGLNVVVGVEGPTAFEQFTQGLTAASEDLEKQFQSWEEIGRRTAGHLHEAFADEFFAVMKGDFDDLEDAWKGLLDAILREIANFLAAEAVKQLLGLGKDLLNSVSDGGGGDGGSGVVDVAKRIFSIDEQTRQGQQRLELEQKITGESKKRLELEMSLTDAAKAAGRVGLAAGTGLVTGGPVGAAIKGLTALANEINTALQDAKVTETKQAMLDSAQALEGLTQAATTTGQEATRAMQAMDRNTAATTSLSISTDTSTAGFNDLSTAMDAQSDSVANAQASVDTSTAGFNDLSTGMDAMSDSLANASTAVDTMGPAVEGFHASVEAAVESINGAVASIEDRIAADNARGFGPGGDFQGGGKGSPDTTNPDSPTFGGPGGGLSDAPGFGPGGSFSLKTTQGIQLQLAPSLTAFNSSSYVAPQDMLATVVVHVPGQPAYTETVRVPVRQVSRGAAF